MDILDASHNSKSDQAAMLLASSNTGGATSPPATTFVAPDDCEDIMVSWKDGTIQLSGNKSPVSLPEESAPNPTVDTTSTPCPKKGSSNQQSPPVSPSNDTNEPTHDELLGGSFRSTATTSTRSSPDTTEEDFSEGSELDDKKVEAYQQACHVQSQSLARERPTVVHFSTVEIREYNRCPGDNPSVQCGVPLSIDWSVQHSTTCSLDEREKALQGRPVKSLVDLRVIPLQRTQMMLEWGFSRGEIRERVQMVDKWRENREKTLIQLERRDRLKRRLKAPFRLIAFVLRGGRRRKDYCEEDEYDYDEQSEDEAQNTNDGTGTNAEIAV